MTKLSDLPKDFYLEYYRQISQIDKKDVSLLWHDGYYDGPLDGVLLYQGKIHWFQIFHALRIDEVRTRVDEEGVAWNDHFVRYLVIQLSEEQIREEAYWHELFQISLTGFHFFPVRTSGNQHIGNTVDHSTCSRSIII